MNSFSGPDPNVDEIQRIQNKIKNKRRQLPFDFPNILMLYAGSFFLRYPDILHLMHILEEDIFVLNNVAVVIIHGGYLGSIKPSQFEHDGHLYIQKSQDKIHADQYLILFNRFCKVPVRSDTITKIKRSIIEN
jgi:hypothetical protein